MSKPRFQIFKGKDKKFYFRLIARNGETILASQAYRNLAGCEKGIASVKTNGANFDNYEFSIAKNDQFYFVLKASNKEVIGTSETYTTKQACRNGAIAVLNATLDADVENLV